MAESINARADIHDLSIDGAAMPDIGVDISVCIEKGSVILAFEETPLHSLLTAAEIDGRKHLSQLLMLLDAEHIGGQ